MTGTETETIADVIDAAVRYAMGPYVADVKVLQSQIATWEARWGDLGALRERVAVVESKSQQTTIARTPDDVLTRLTALESVQPIPGPVGPQGERGEPGPQGEPGRDGVNGKDGTDGTRGADGKDGLDGKDGALGLDGKEGPAGRDGVDGRDGQPGVPGVPGRDGAPGIAGEKGQDGAPGRDGTLETLQLERVDERSWRFVRADATPLPGGVLTFDVVLDRGVYQAARTYAKGDGVTFGGSFWIAQDATSEKPGDGATKWRLAVKAGREGREGKPGPAGERGARGEKGDPGRDYR